MPFTRVRGTKELFDCNELIIFGNLLSSFGREERKRERGRGTGRGGGTYMLFSYINYAIICR